MRVAEGHGHDKKSSRQAMCCQSFSGVCCATIRWSGVLTAFEYAMREDYLSARISGEACLGQITLLAQARSSACLKIMGELTLYIGTNTN